MMRHLRVTLFFHLLALVAGCQIADQAVNALKPTDTTNILKEQDIKSLSTIPLAQYPTTTQHDGEVLTVERLPGERPAVLSVGKDSQVIAWDLTEGKGHVLTKLPSAPRAVALGERRALIAWADEQGVFVTCIVGCSQRLRFTNSKLRPTSLAFHGDDTSLLIGGGDGRIYRWRFMDEQTTSSMEEREKMIERYFGHHTIISGVVGHSVGRAFFSSDWDGALIGWLAYSEDDFGGAYDKNLFKGRNYADIPANMRSSRRPDRGISSLEISKNGDFIGIGTDEGFVEVWRVKGFSLSARKQLHTGRVMAVALSDSGDRIASVGKDSKVRVSYTTPDPMNTISPAALEMQLVELSEHTVPAAQGVAFASPKRLAVTTKTGELVEVTLDDVAVTKPTPPPLATPRGAVDGDY